MTTDSTKQNPTGEAEPVNESELSEETIEDISGGVGIGPLVGMIPPNEPRKPEEPTPGYVTGSW